MFRIFNIKNKPIENINNEPIRNTNPNNEPIECIDDEIKLDKIEKKKPACDNLDFGTLETGPVRPILKRSRKEPRYLQDFDVTTVTGYDDDLIRTKDVKMF
ncbi:hypothetical protein QTP88_002033 [Uroleucon formosanum]